MSTEPNPLLLKLSYGSQLNEEDLEQLRQVSSRRRMVAAGDIIIREGERPDDVHLVISGMAYRYKQTVDGQRSIMALLLPGDICDLNVALLDYMDHTIAALAPSEMVDIPRRAIIELTDNPRIARALWWANLVDEAVLREWLLNMGHRSATEQIAHLICELHDRLSIVGLVSGTGFRLPLTQAQLGELFGMSTVHINRTMQALRAQDLFDLARARVMIPDLDRLRAYAGYDPSYLHLRRDGAG